MRRFLTTLRLALAALVVCGLAHAGDPFVDWYTVETPHFRIHYHSGLDEHAQQVASLAEVVHERLIPETGWRPKQVIHVVLTDDTDSANGSARVVPNKLIRMYMTAPDDMSALNDFDDWMLLLFTHEHTHILHIDNVTGVPALANAILGRTYVPNQAVPKWITEGWAVYLESKYSSGGRLRSALFDMYLRADFLASKVKTLDEVSSDPRRWPGGTVWYLYGGKFLEWVSETYGEDTLAAMAADYGDDVLVWGINRSIRRATGLTYPELWAGWQHHLATVYGAQLRAVEARGLREGKRLTFRGRDATHPRFVPAAAQRHGEESLFYWSGDGHSTGGWYRVPLAARDRAARRPRLEIRSNGAVGSFTADGDFVFDTVAPSKRQYYFLELFRQPRGTRSPRGIEATREQLTFGRRASQPDVSRDGHHVTYVTNRAGTSTLRIADLDAEGALVNERILVPSATYEQAYTPRFSPDGQHVAYSAWTHGGYRDIRIVEVATGHFRELFHDRASEQQPTWSADGKTLYFVSDRTGIANVYAFDLATAELFQVTNVRTGAYMPEVTPDERTLYYVGYTHAGFDLYALAIDRQAWLPAEPYVPRRPGMQPSPPLRRYPVRPYRARETLRPYAYEFELGPGTFGNALILTASGADAAGLHAIAASITADTEEGLPAASLSYAYRRLPFDLTLRGYRNAVPRTYEVGDRTPRFVEYSTGIASGISLPLPRPFDSQTLSLTYSAAEVSSEVPVRGLEDPYALVTKEPYSGLFASVDARYSYSNVQRSTYGVGSERGYAVSLGTEYAGPETGSESTLASLTGRIRGYVPLPWARHHVFAAALSGGSGTGSYAKRGLFYTGGFVAPPLLDAFQEGVSASGFVLRGYEPAQYVGEQYALFNTEYRFPIVYVDRGVSTLPVFLRSIAGNLFADYGGAFDRIDFERPLDSLQLGLGGELWFDVTLGYTAPGHLRLGYARGTDSDAVTGGQTYLIASGSF